MLALLCEGKGKAEGIQASPSAMPDKERQKAEGKGTENNNKTIFHSGMNGRDLHDLFFKRY